VTPWAWHSTGVYAACLDPDILVLWRAQDDMKGFVEVVEFESADPRLRGEMKMTASLREVAAGTEVTLRFDDIPAGISPHDNEKGTQQSLRKLAALLE
jgi:Activator of Hsp90 ATPase homolog 1-like protein